MKILCYIFPLFLFTIGCGLRYNAQALISDFLENNLINNDIQEKTFSDIDSTFYINDSIVNTMRSAAQSNRIVKKETEYHNKKDSDKLLFMSVTYTTNNATKQKLTFYMDAELKNVIAFKQDAI